MLDRLSKPGFEDSNINQSSTRFLVYKLLARFWNPPLDSDDTSLRELFNQISFYLSSQTTSVQKLIQESEYICVTFSAFTYLSVRFMKELYMNSVENLERLK
jgi:hypothetical protein